MTDINPDNAGREKYGVRIEGVSHTAEIIRWGSVVFATGSTLVNDTYRSLLRNKPIVFYGVTMSGIGFLTDCPCYCPLGQ